MGHTTTLLVWLQLWHPIGVAWFAWCARCPTCSSVGWHPVDFPQSLGLKPFVIVEIMPCKMYLTLWCLSLVTDGLRSEVGYISDVAEVQEDPSLQMAWIWFENMIGEDVTFCIPQRFGPRCLEVSLEYEFGDDTSRKSTVQIFEMLI